MSEIRFSYHPKKKLLLVSDFAECHGDTIAKKGKKLPFDEFIRGIITDKGLYLRIYYPLNDLEKKTLEELEAYSFDRLFDELKPIRKALKLSGVKCPGKVFYNVTNEALRGIIANI